MVEIAAGVKRRWRLINEKGLSGPENMARDVALAESVCAGFPPFLRLYSFKPYCVTIGKFQKADPWISGYDLKGAGIDLTRRPTGGMAIFHKEDFTYSVSLPHRKPATEIKATYFKIVADAVVESLKYLNIPAEIVSHNKNNAKGSVWCFASEVGVDIEYEGKKICGSAQKIFKNSVLQHGSLFLKPDSNIEMCKGIFNNEKGDSGNTTYTSLREAGKRDYCWEEVAEAFTEGFSNKLGIEMKLSTLNRREKERAILLKKERYGNRDWISGKASGKEFI